MRYLFCILGLIASVSGLYDYGVDPSTFIKRDQQSNLFLVGSHTPDGSLAMRREIRDLQKDAKTWNLYLLGMNMMQWSDQTKRESWYQLMGIHGRPFQAFDNVQAIFGNDRTGYGTYTSVLFPAWHRPYLALYEQILYSIIQNIARIWPGDEYIAAAAKFRIPYWDWAMITPPGQQVLSASFQSDTIVMDGPNGPQTISNPLYSYIFNPLNPSDLQDPPCNTLGQSVRYSYSKGASQNSLVADQLDVQALALRSRLNTLFSNYHNYIQFSNEA